MNIRNLLTIALVMALSTMYCQGNVNANDNKNKSNESSENSQKENGSSDLILKKLDKGNIDKKTSGNNVRAGQLIGMDIVNPDGESIGEVHDLVLNSKTRCTNYVVVTYGGFLGFGDKLFAVPYRAFDVKIDHEDKTNHLLTLDVTQDQLDGAKGFDEEHWPDFANKEFLVELDKRYQVEDKKESNVDKKEHQEKKLGVLDDKTDGVNIRYSQLAEMDIYDTNDVKIGEIEDIVLASHSGDIQYAGANFDELLGDENEQLYPIGFDKFQVERMSDEKDEYFLVLDINKDHLKNVKGFDSEHWPDYSERKMTKESDKQLKIGVDSRGVDVEVDVQ